LDARRTLSALGLRQESFASNMIILQWFNFITGNNSKAHATMRYQ
jgi:hypothetical protein